MQLGTLTQTLNIRDGSSKEVAVKISKLSQALNGSYFAVANVIAPTETVQGASSGTFAVAPAHIDLSGAITSVPMIGHLGSSINVTLDVTNSGNEPADGTLEILFELSPFQSGANSIQVATVGKHITLKGGKSQVLHLRVPVALGSPSGNQFIVAVVDPGDRFNDSNLANNTAVSATPVSFR